MYFLNHGSFGAAPRPVLAAQRAWQERMELQPVRFMTSELPAALAVVRERLATFLECRSERLALVENASDGVNAVLRSFPWRAGDEIAIAEHAYPAIRHTVEFVAARHGLRIVVLPVPFPVESGAQLAGIFCAGLSEHTRLLVVDHVFSPLALVMPLAPVIAFCRARGIRVLVDGAHAPGMLPLALDALAADWYVGNCHKWLFAPKGCAFLYVAEDHARDLHPTVISNDYGRGFVAEFAWQGTRDCSAWLALPAALDFVETLGVERYRAWLRSLLEAAVTRLAVPWQVAVGCPPDLWGGMLTLPLPSACTEQATPEMAARLHDWLWQTVRVEVPVLCFNGGLWVRVSAQVYNEAGDWDALAGAVEELLSTGGLR